MQKAMLKIFMTSFVKSQLLAGSEASSAAHAKRSHPLRCHGRDLHST